MDSKPKKPSYVGPKIVNLKIKDRVQEVVFSSSIVLNKVIKQLVGTDPKESEVLHLFEGSERISILFDNIDAIWFSQDKLFEIDRKDVYNFTLFFEDGSSITFPVLSEIRLRINYKMLEEFIGKSETPNNNFIEIPQEKTKAAYIRFTSKLVAISTKMGQK